MRINRAHAASRIAAALFGGYAFVWAFITLVIALGLHAGIRYGEPQTLAFLLAFLVFLTVFCWAFASRSVVWVWCVLAGGGAFMTAAAWLATRAIA